MKEKTTSRIRSFKSFIPFLMASVAVLGNSSIAKAVDFNFTYEDGVTFEQIAAMETAGMIWSDYLADDITVNIHVESTNVLDSNIVGGALPGMVSNYKYGTFRSLLNNDSTSVLDNTAYSNLSVKQEHGQDKFTAWFDTGISGYTEDHKDLNLTRANAKAIGAINAHDSDLDGYILMNDLSNSAASWNYDLANGSVDSNSLDYLSVAAHEIGHVLGFVSGVDKIDIDKYDDWNSLLSNYGDNNGVMRRMDELLNYATPLDMFRYSSQSKQADNNNEDYNIIDFSTSQQAYFSLDGGDTLMYQFAQGQDDDEGWGDGYQASHWKQKDSNQIGIMDPLIDLGQRRELSNRDMVAFDTIGYDLTANANAMIGAGNAANSWLVTGMGTDLSTLEYQAKDKKVKKYHSDGDASWIDWAIDNGYNTATSDYTQNRTDDVEKMIRKSKIYQGRRGGWGQTAAFWQEAYLQEFKWQTVDLEADSQAVPEPGSTAGFLAMGFLGLGTLLKRKKK